MLTGSPRRAINPGDAVLSYAYRLLEIEACVECLAHGLDVTLEVGPLHAGRDGRSSLACTVMEAARPAVDAAVLHFLGQRTLAVSDFLEMADGHVRIQLGLARQLAELMPAFRSRDAPASRPWPTS